MIPYIDRDFIRFFVVSFLILAAFVQIGYLVSVLLEMYQFAFGAGGSKLGWVLLYYIITVPRQAAYTIPVGTAVAILWVCTVKARHNEILAYLVGGVSPMRIAAPLLSAALVFSVLCYLTIELLANPGDRLANRIERVNIQGRSVETVAGEQNIFQKGRGNRFFSISSFDPTRERMENPTIIDMGSNWNTPEWRLDASRAERHGNDDSSVWLFEDATFRRYARDGTVSEFRSGKELSEKDLGVTLEGELTNYLRQRFRPSEMGFAELINYIGLFREQKKPTYRLETHLYFNFAVPFGCFVLAVLMCGHILRPSSSGIVVGFGGGLVLIALYYVVLLSFRQMSLYGFALLPPLAAAVIPNVIFLSLGVYLLNRYRAL